MVSKADLCQKVDLELIAQHVRPSIYEPSQFPAVFYRVVNPRTTFVIFSSGKVMAYGGQKLEDVRSHFVQLLNELRPLGIATSTTKPPEICMLVGNSETPDRIDIEQLSRTLVGAVYEPEQFPGLIWHRVGKEAVLVFASGKIHITGPKSIERMNLILDELLDFVQQSLVSQETHRQVMHPRQVMT